MKSRSKPQDFIYWLLTHLHTYLILTYLYVPMGYPNKEKVSSVPSSNRTFQSQKNSRKKPEPTTWTFLPFCFILLSHRPKRNRSRSEKKFRSFVQKFLRNLLTRIQKLTLLESTKKLNRTVFGLILHIKWRTSHRVYQFRKQKLQSDLTRLKKKENGSVILSRIFSTEIRV